MTVDLRQSFLPCHLKDFFSAFTEKLPTIQKDGNVAVIQDNCFVSCLTAKVPLTAGMQSFTTVLRTVAEETQNNSKLLLSVDAH